MRPIYVSLSIIALSLLLIYSPSGSLHPKTKKDTALVILPDGCRAFLPHITQMAAEAASQKYPEQNRKTKEFYVNTLYDMCIHANEDHCRNDAACIEKCAKSCMDESIERFNAYIIENSTD